MSYVKTLLFLLPLALILTLSACDDSDNDGIVYSWVQAGPNNSAIARVITIGDNCPDIKIDGELFEMEVRSEPSSDFPVLVCELTIPNGAESASVKGRHLPLFKENTTRIVVIGDTGCRIEEGETVQDCNDPEAWPFKKIADSAASFNPDVVIHVGDYVYRESPCPEGDEGCAGTPFGYNFATWNVDVFSPADSLLRKAPWVFTRGNHELCSREGPGWFTFLDPNPPFAECQEFTPPYTVDLGIVRLLMLDSSATDDDNAPPDTTEVMASQIDSLEAASGENAWMVTHIPFWAIGFGNGELFTLDDTLQTASDNNLTGGINLVLSGHLHSLETLFVDADRQPQFIVGNSGTELDLPVTDIVGMEIAGATAVEGSVNISEFGYATMELVDGVWDVRMIGVDGEELWACEIDGADVECFP